MALSSSLHLTSETDRSPVGLTLTVLLMIAILIAPYGMRALTWLAPVAALMIAFQIDFRRQAIDIFARPTMAITGLFILYGLASALWAPDGARALSKAGALAGYLVTVLLLLHGVETVSRAALERMFKVLSWCFVATLFLLVLYRIFDLHPIMMFRQSAPGHEELARLSVYNRGLSFLVLTGLVLTTYWLLRHKRLAVLIALSTIFVIVLYSGLSNMLAVTVGFGGMALLVLVRKKSFFWITILICLVIALGPILMQGAASPEARDIAANLRLSALHRLDIWLFVTENIASHPIVGWGLGSSRDIPGGERIMSYGPNILPNHPHNASLQLWLETGVIGIVLVIGAIARGALKLEGLANATGKTDANAALSAFVMSLTVIAMLGYGVLQSIWMATVLVSIVLMVAALRANSDPDGIL